MTIHARLNLTPGIVAVLLAVAALSAGASDWQAIDSHPQPIWARPWVNLNGPWRFEFDPDDKGIAEQWFQKHAYSKQIEAPYPWQSALSGIGDVDYQGVAWYERDVAIPEDAGPRIFLVFGAVDWQATVWIDGAKAAEHEGGYTPFEIELTSLVKPGQTARVTLRAYDVTDRETPNGKQTGWYTRTGGIWQTVYLESRGRAHVRQAHITPDIDNEQAAFDLICEVPEPGAYELRVAVDGLRAPKPLVLEPYFDKAGPQPCSFSLPVPDPKLWTPDTPYLYNVTLRLGSKDSGFDEVHTYFGMRKIERGTYAGSKHEYILLNGKPIYLRGALHQSFNPEGIYTHPDDEFMRRDYEKAKEFGLNYIRIHIKIEEPRALYWADKLGVMLMCDIPNFQDFTPRAQQTWEDTMRGAVARDFNHPSIIAWCCFNETWGFRDGGYVRAEQEWVRDMYLLTKRLDPSRLVEDNSPCTYDHTETDINSWHFYIDRYDRARDHVAEVVASTYPGSEFNYADGWQQGTAPLMNSEYGGVGAGSGDRDISWVFLFLTNLLRKYDPICGYVYTELSDIEWEHNGFMNYDRSPKAYHYPAGITVADLQGAEFPVLDCPPYQRVSPGQRVSIPVLLSHWTERDGLRLRLFVDGTTVDGRAWDKWIAPIKRDVDAKPYAVTPQGSFDFEVPDARGLINVVAEVLDDGRRVAANYCVLDVRGACWTQPGQYAASFPVDQMSGYEFDIDGLSQCAGRGKVGGYSAGAIEYRLRLPEDLDAGDVAGCRLVVEAGARAGAERLDWPARRRPYDYPQTDGTQWPTDVTISLNGIPFEKVAIESDFADARGVLSHEAHFHHGSCGRLIDAAIDGAALDAIRDALKADRVVTLRFDVPADAAHVGGLALYGADMGAYPIDPTLVFALRRGASAPKGALEAVDTLYSRQVTLLAPGPKGHEWKYTFKDPGERWNAPDFDDAAWQTGKSGFGTEGTPGARLGTIWNTPDIWLRTAVDMPEALDTCVLWADLHHDEDVEVYVNGKRLLSRRRYRSDYDRIPLTAEQRALFTPGATNLIAIHCHQSAGGQFVDLGLTMLGK
ncbi:MAG: hypothetical protein JXR94_15600 [Candidatus Hydrogenedentes bacterium]|nr:hypothetical protein [Candidatus Hydrogenedentota bacterium]